MEIITRETALKQGLAWYFTGKLCKHGHVTKRHVNGRGCTECNKKNQRARRARRLGRNGGHGAPAIAKDNSVPYLRSTNSIASRLGPSIMTARVSPSG